MPPDEIESPKEQLEKLKKYGWDLTMNQTNKGWEKIERAIKGVCIVCGEKHNPLGFSKGIKINLDGSVETYTHSEELIEPELLFHKLLSQKDQEWKKDIKRAIGLELEEWNGNGEYYSNVTKALNQLKQKLGL